MFDDVLGSSKGPGIIGTLMAVLVLGGFAGLGMMATSYEEGGERIDAAVIEQRDRIEDLNEELDDKKKDRDLYRGYQKKLPNVSLQAKLLDLRKNREVELKKKLTFTQNQINNLGQSFEEYKALYRKNERELAIGEVHDFSSFKGARFKKAKILRVDAMGVRVGISSGPKGIKYDELPQKLKDRFQFHQDEANVFRNELNIVEGKRTESAVKWNKEKQALKAAANTSKKVSQIAQKRRQITSLYERVKKKNSAAKSWRNKADRYDSQARQARARGAIPADGSNARKARATANRLKRSVEATRREIAKLKSEVMELQRSLRK